MRKLIFCLTLLLFAVSVSAEEKEMKKGNESDNTATIVLSGIVRDSKSGELLTGVEIKIDGTDIKTYSDFDGNFSFNKIKPGDYKLVSSYISYKKSIESFSLDGKENRITIVLENSN
ncbi:MAG: carboxypeptidase-like regulatory domain-containing protein [Prolixibacteraceae bacterium]|nr:carboxypeptidase-like regulatory domain-containing protein [Prolixibacteraceae bacterium]